MMLCRNPYTSGATAYPCGQCMPCRYNRRRIWTHRIVLESMQYKDNCFATLTYDDEHVDPNGSLRPRDVQLWLKRLRKVYDRPIRFYVVGEYGSVTQRPHYHAALFNVPRCVYGQSQYSLSRRRCCVVCDTIRDTWGLGNTSLGLLEPASASYVAGYVTKKMTSKDDPRLNGRHPEFARMSNRPGIGATAMHEVASELLRYDFEKTSDDVPQGLRHGRAVLPLGRYLRKKLRCYCGLPENAPQKVLDEMAEELRPMYEIALATARPKGQRINVFKSLLVEQERTKVASLEFRQANLKERRAL